MVHWPPCIALPITVFFFTIRENVMRDAWKQNRVGGFASQTQHNEEKPVKRSRLCSETRSRLSSETRSRLSSETRSRLKVRPGRCAAGSSRPRRFAAEIAPGPGIATGNAAAIRETRPEAPDLEESGASGAGRLSVAATMRSWRRFRRRCGRTCRCRPSRWSRGGSCPSCGLRPRPQRRARGSARPPRRALRRRR